MGAKQFEELQVMKLVWWQNIIDLAAWNSVQVEGVELDEYSELLHAEALATEWDQLDVDEFAMDDWRAVSFQVKIYRN